MPDPTDTLRQREPDPRVEAAPVEVRPPCSHDSTRRDLTLDDHCLKCGADGYWHYGHRHDEPHPSGKTLIRLGCPDAAADRVAPDREEPPNMLSLELAWGLIANAWHGNWEDAPVEWREAAERWRDEHWHKALDRLREPLP